MNIHNEELSKVQVTVLNNTGAKLVQDEIAVLNGFIGFVADFDGIENGAVGLLNIDERQLVNSDQVEPTDNFTIRTICYFNVTTKTIRAAGAAGDYPLGYIEAFEDAKRVKYKPFPQNGAVVVVT